MGRKFTIFALFYFVFEGKFQVQAPREAYIWRGDLTEGFLRYDIGGLIFGGAYFWNFTVLVYWSITLLLSHVPRPATTSRHFRKPWEYKRTRVSEKHSCKNMLLCNLTTRVLRYLAIWQTYMKYIIYKNCRNAIKWRMILAVVNATYAIAKEAWKKIQDFNKISRPQYSIKYSITKGYGERARYALHKFHVKDIHNKRDTVIRLRIARRSKRAWSNCVLCIPFILSGSPNKQLLATYMRRKRNNNLEITIADSSCRPQLINSTILCGTAKVKCSLGQHFIVGLFFCLFVYF